VKSKERVKSLGEVFTPIELVENMLDRLPLELWADPSKTFCDPSCGNGNFLVAVLKRKLKAKHTVRQALSSVYGVDIMLDNVEECRERLLKTARMSGNASARAIVEQNVVCADALTYDWDCKGCK
jgi:type I restriction-modification system DNA methylase subunit